MKFTCSQSILNANLSLAARAVPSRAIQPILANILMKVSNDQVSLVGFDLGMAIQTSFEAIVEEAGSITIPAKLFSDIVSRIPSDSEITITVKDSAITIQTSSGKYEVKGMPDSDYPLPPIVQQGEPVIIPSGALSTALKSTLFAVATSEAKQVLCGAHLQSVPDGIEIAATDGHRLSVFNIQGQSTDLNLTIPTKALRELERLSGEEEVSLYFEYDLALFVWGSQSLTTRTIGGQYPNYPAIIPKEFAQRITVDRRQLISSLDRISVLADDNNVIKVEISHTEQSLTLMAYASNRGSGKESLPAQVTAGEEMLITFNNKYLADGLKAIRTNEVEICLNHPTAPVVLRPVGEDQIYLLMPIQLRD